jgi:hypothetical protein
MKSSRLESPIHERRPTGNRFPAIEPCIARTAQPSAMDKPFDTRCAE